MTEEAQKWEEPPADEPAQGDAPQGAIEVPTMNLRIYGEKRNAELQQQWAIHAPNGDISSEWRTVPTVPRDSTVAPDDGAADKTE